jgi:hypothetical protein
MQDLQPEFLRGFKQRTFTQAFSEELWNPNEPELKKSKLNDENSTGDPEESEEKESVLDLSIFGELPEELLRHHVVLALPLDWIYVSKFYHELAMNNLDRDPRILWNNTSFAGAMAVGNLRVVKMHLERHNIEEKHKETCFLWAVSVGCATIVEYFVNNNVLTIDFRQQDFYTKSTTVAIEYGWRNIVEILLNSGKVAHQHGKNDFLEIAAIRKRPNIVELLLQNGFYQESSITTVLKTVIARFNGCDVSVVRVLIRFIQHTLTSAETLDLLILAIEKGVFDVVEYILDEVLESETTIGEEIIWLALHHRYRADIFRKLKSDSRSVWNPTFLATKAAVHGYPDILRFLLYESDFDVKTTLNADLFEQALKNNADNHTNTVFVMLGDPRVNFNFYASFSVYKAIQYSSIYVAETIMNDERFIVMDTDHYKNAMQFAEKNFKTQLIQRLEGIKNQAVLSPDEIWSQHL